MSKLLIVESPAKAKTIGKYLGGDFTVKSSVGHVRDLPKKGGLAIRIDPVDGAKDEWAFTPSYVVSPEKRKVVAELRAAAKKADEIYLAPDPDREGEAIAWHLSEVLAKELKGKKVARVTYNEITKPAVQAAVANPGEIDMARVDAQQARRILDRLVGFKVSPMLWKYLPRGGRSLSAGRVQSVALRLIVEREREIRSFVPEPYWVFGVEARKDGVAFAARLARIDGKKPDIREEQAAESTVKDLEGATLRVDGVKEQPKSRHPYPPFTTSTLQQAASSVCGFSPHRTMGLAQKLYEEGLITYMRTDSVNIAQSARDAAAAFISGAYGKEFLPETPNFYKSKSGAQEAHEAIRPTDVMRKPGELEGLDPASLRLYDLIWRRFVASQMADARFSLRTVAIKAEKDGIAHDYQFTASTTSVTFEGFLKAMPGASKRKQDGDEESDEVNALPPLAAGDVPEVVRWLSDRKETKPPPRFSEAALVKALEENGVGRPSTYAQTIEVLVDRSYAERESRQMVPTKLGEDVNDWLVSRMPALFDVGYTAQMEAELDKVEEGAETEDRMLSSFYAKFLGWLDSAKDPPPDPERFRALLALFDDVKEWREPKSVGKKVYDDREFLNLTRERLETAPDRLSERQLKALASLAASYRDQIPDVDARLEKLGWGEVAERARMAPPPGLVNECFAALEAAGELSGDKFLASLRRQVDHGSPLSEKQFAALVRSALERVGDGEAATELKRKLAAYAPDGGKETPPDPTVPGLFEMAAEVTSWREPTRRGRRVYDDREFAESLKRQFAAKGTLSPRQTEAFRKMLAAYRSQIRDFEERAKQLGFPAALVAPRRKGSETRR